MHACMYVRMYVCMYVCLRKYEYIYILYCIEKHVSKKWRTRRAQGCTRPKLEKPRCTRFGRSQPAQGAQGNTPVLLPCAGACARLVRPFALELVQTKARTRSCTRHVQDFVLDFRDFAFHIKVRPQNITCHQLRFHVSKTSKIEGRPCEFNGFMCPRHQKLKDALANSMVLCAQDIKN